MKKLFFPFAFMALLVLSCNNNESKPVAVTDTTASGSSLSPMAQKNLDATHTVMKAFLAGDASSIDSVVAATFVDHTDKGEANRDSLKAMIKKMGADKTLKMETTKELADDEYVVSLTHISGTGDGTTAPPGPYDMHTINVIKFAGGKAIEHWGYMEMGEVSKMMAHGMPGMDKMKTPEAGKQ